MKPLDPLFDFFFRKSAESDHHRLLRAAVTIHPKICYRVNLYTVLFRFVFEVVRMVIDLYNNMEPSFLANDFYRVSKIFVNL